MAQKIEAILIKKFVLNDVDIVATVFSRELGKIQIIAPKGKKNNHLQPKLELFSHNIFVISDKNKLPIIYQADPLSSFDNIGKNYKIYHWCSQLTIDISSLVVSHQPNPELYELFLGSLIKLNSLPQNSDIITVIRSIYAAIVSLEGISENRELPIETYQQLIKEYRGENLV